MIKLWPLSVPEVLLPQVPIVLYLEFRDEMFFHTPPVDDVSEAL